VTKPSYSAEYRRTERIVYLDLSAPVTLEDLHNGMSRLAVDEGWTETKFNNRWSYLRRSVERTVATGSTLASDLRPGLELLASHAPPPDGKSSVRKSLSLLLGRPLAQRKRRVPPSPEIWTALLSTTTAMGRKTHPLANLELAIRAAGGIASAPREMPSAAELEAAAERIDMPRSTLRTGLALYRDAREELIKLNPEVAANFGAIPLRHGRRRGLHSLSRSVLRPLLDAQGITADPADLDWTEIMAAVAPLLHQEYQEWLKRPLRGSQPGEATPGSIYSTGLVLNRFVTGMIVAGRSASLREMSLLDIFVPSEPPYRTLTTEDPLTARARARAGRAEAPVLHQPVRVSLDAMADGARQNAGIEDEGVGYTISTVSDVQRLWGMVGGVFRLRLLDSDPAAWTPYERHFEHCFDLIRSQQLEARASRNPCTTLDLVSLPQLVCLGIPMLKLERERARNAWREACARVAEAGHDVVEHPVSAKAHREYAHAAEVLLAAGVYAADGLRLSNYRCGILGRHYLIEFERDERGRACGIARISSDWTGKRADPARTKRENQKKASRVVFRSAVNRRINPDWPSAYVCRRALWEYLSEVTLVRVIQAGALPSDATVEDLVNARAFTLFVSRKRMCNGECRVTRMSVTQVGVNLAGYALWWTARHALGRALPDWDNLDRAGEYFRALVGHDYRMLTTCFWGLVMGDWSYAAWLTNDREETLRDFYSADIFQRWRELGGADSHWDHPHAFRSWMTAIKDRAISEVDVLDPALPLPPAAEDYLRRHGHLPASGKRGKVKKRPSRLGVRRSRKGQRLPTRSA
jgi:hypothetical protein